MILKIKVLKIWFCLCLFYHKNMKENSISLKLINIYKETYSKEFPIKIEESSLNREYWIIKKWNRLRR